MSAVQLEMRALAPELLADFLAYFEGDAFSDNPKWRSCCCQFLYVDHARISWPARPFDENRSAACERICSGRMQGLLAYRSGKPVGWCNVAPRTLMDAFVNEADPDFDRLGQITGLVVARPYRRTDADGTVIFRRDLAPV